MIGIVRVALHRPLTFVVMAIVIAIVGVLAAVRMPVDIFPNIRIPVIAVAWQYAGLPAGGHGEPHRQPIRTHPDDHGQRYRAYREPVDAGASRS